MKIAIITGASSGMGREFALQLPAWEQFDELWVIARRENRLEELKTRLSVPVRTISLDLCHWESIEQLEKLLKDTRPNVALLANIAGFGRFGRCETIPTDVLMRMIDLNCKAMVALTQAVLPYMHKGAKIVNLDSLSAFQPVPYLAVYGATKSFVLSYSRALNQELKPRGIRVMSVNPGWVRTEFFQEAEKSNHQDVTYFNRVYEAKDVIATALKDLYKRKKDVSIHGLPVRNQVRLVKLLPHSLVMKIWLHQQDSHRKKK